MPAFVTSALFPLFAFDVPAYTVPYRHVPLELLGRALLVPSLQSRWELALASANAFMLEIDNAVSATAGRMQGRTSTAGAFLSGPGLLFCRLVALAPLEV